MQASGSTRGLRRALVALALVAVLLGAVVAALTLRSAHLHHGRGLWAASFVLVGWSFVGAGLVAWARRPVNPVGALMVAVGFTWLASRLEVANGPVLFSVGLLFDAVFVAVALHMLLAFPSGRLTGRPERVLVGLGYAAATALGTGRLLFGGLDECPDCPPSVLALVRDGQAFAALTAAERALAMGLLLAAAVVLLRRWWRASCPERQPLAVVLWAGASAVTVNAAALAAALARAPAAEQRDLRLAGLALFALLPFAFLAGLLRGRLAHAQAVSDLVEQLAPAPLGHERLRAALSEALRDPSLQLAYWIPGGQRYVDAAGAPVELPGPGSRLAFTVVRRRDEPVAAVIHDRALAEEPELVGAAGAALALALDNQRLEAELRAHVEQLAASRARLVQAAVAERRRLERNLHDGAQQRLVSTLVGLKLARRGVAAQPDLAEALLEHMEGELALALAELRELARGLHPPALADRGLPAALRELANRAPLPVELEVELPGRLPDHVEATVYYLVAETLTNAAKHAGAHEARVAAAVRDGLAHVEVHDDGRGGVDPARGSGLHGLEDRLAAVAGWLRIESPPGGGTHVHAVVPLDPEAPCGR
jgi:signal transduction histidine kinase